ncbi:type I-D CRISPR-associated helicase Cas3' [Planktothrix sp.]|uniref:type I-D CRISPR-associated helicase Cas3' n=1 Tax=Planktothrix sp. TaxID=3088171 RepID=UPI0038D431AE
MSIHSSLKQESLIVDTYSITLKPVYSCPASEPLQGVTLPPGWTLAWHQAETFKALSDPNIDVVFNTAMTGDGKSLAAYLKAMTGRNYTLAMYPTNELARDQQRQVQNYKTQFQPDYDPQIYRLNGSILDDFIETNQLPSRQQALINRTDNSEILLTNPDIFHYIHDFRYLRRNKDKKGDNADKLFRRIDQNYKFFIFDEFHVFSSPQIASVMNALLLIKHTSVDKKFLFLSATPSEILQNFLFKSGLKYRIIDPVAQGAYQFDPNLVTTGWRPISQGINLTFPKDLEPNFRSGYDWLVENSETVILNFFLNYPGSKGAIILNSIASVYKLLPKLRELFELHNLTVIPNTSLTGETEKAKSIAEADLVIGTSTIDIGVDFNINFLIFEAADAGNFIQRFGRLGRHPNFPIYQAYALIPNFLVARLFSEKSPLKANEDYDRITFTQTIPSCWSFVNQFENYPKRWGGIQSACVHIELGRMKNEYPEAANDFKRDIESAFGMSLGHKYGQIKHCLNEKKNKIIQEARSFRGSSQLDCALYDLTNPEEPEKERFKTYHLPGILSNFIIEWMEEKDFMKKVEIAGLPKKRFENALCYLKLIDYREVRENWHFYYSGDDFDEIKKSGKVQVLKGLEITNSINAISRALYRRGVVCFISDRDRSYLQAKLGLPMQFQAYGIDNKLDEKPPYTIAFGQSALMLETLIWCWKPKEDEGWIC